MSEGGRYYTSTKKARPIWLDLLDVIISADLTSCFVAVFVDIGAVSAFVATPAVFVVAVAGIAGIAAAVAAVPVVATADTLGAVVEMEKGKRGLKRERERVSERDREGIRDKQT